MGHFASNFTGHKDGLTLEQAFYDQIYTAFEKNTQEQTLPFFDKNLHQVPQEITSGKFITDENAIALEQIASAKGYKSNLWIYGDELNKIEKKVGDLFMKPHTQAVLCVSREYNPTHSKDYDLYIKEAGTQQNAQYLYNVDSLTPKSQEKFRDYIEKSQKVNQQYCAENFSSFAQSAKNVQAQNVNPIVQSAKEKVLNFSSIQNIDSKILLDCHFKHNLQNACGNKIASNHELNKSLCYETAQKIIAKTNDEKIEHHKTGQAIAKSLFAGTEFSRVLVARNNNLENIKLREEKLAAEQQINKTNKQFRKTLSMER